MRTLMGFAALLAVLSLAQGCAHTRNPLVGTWEMRLPAAGGDRENAQAARAVKMLNDTHFSFAICMQDGQILSGGGRYRYIDHTYAEIIEYHYMTELVGRTLLFDCRLDGDEWRHSGTVQTENQSLQLHEVWRRVP
jgi:hypothetical protein